MKQLHARLRALAHQYHKPEFVENDPVQFPHGYCKQQDIEISGLLTAYISFGRRVMIIDSATRLDAMMGHRPHAYVLSEAWRADFNDSRRTFYRTLNNGDMARMFEFLYGVYRDFQTMEEWILNEKRGLPIDTLLYGLGLKRSSAQKKLNMFLRWMVRKNSPVDLGCWSGVDPCELIIPLDTHVHQMALELGITKSKTASFKTAEEITEFFKVIFPDDPCLGDFALFGMGVNR